MPTPPLAGAHGHEMAHPGEPVGNAGALLGNLLEDSGPSIADDVVVALHVLRSIHRASLLGPRPRCVESMPASGAETEHLQELR